MMDQPFWEDIFLSRTGEWGGDPNPQLVRECSALTPGRALDAATGEGTDFLQPNKLRLSSNRTGGRSSCAQRTNGTPSILKGEPSSSTTRCCERRVYDDREDKATDVRNRFRHTRRHVSCSVAALGTPLLRRDGADDNSDGGQERPIGAQKIRYLQAGNGPIAIVLLK